MSKKYQNKLCVYCATARSDGRDHVFAEKFFLVQDRSNLPQVPACSNCNGKKSELEHYVLTILPFCARHSTARANLETLVPKRLRGNAPLRSVLEAGCGQVQVEDRDGHASPATALPFDSGQLGRLFEFIGRGLLWYHWQTYLSEADSAGVVWLTRAGETYFEEKLFQLEARNRVKVGLGNDTVEYEGIQGLDMPQISVWRIALFGGVWLAGDPGGPEQVSSTISVITGPNEVVFSAQQAAWAGT